MSEVKDIIFAVFFFGKKG